MGVFVESMKKRARGKRGAHFAVFAAAIPSGRLSPLDCLFIS